MTAINIDPHTIEDLAWDWEHVGIRVQSEPFAIGPISHESHVWIDGEDTGESLDGICAIKVTEDTIDRAQRLAGAYFGQHVALLVSNSIDYGEDRGEIIMHDAEVAVILQ